MEFILDLNMSIDTFLTKRYNKNTYNCAHFVCDLWLHLTGEDISFKLTGFLVPKKDRKVSFSLFRNFTKLDKPQSPCIVLMQSRISDPHVGVFLNGRVIHIKENGVEYQPMEVCTYGYDKIGFYK